MGRDEQELDIFKNGRKNKKIIILFKNCFLKS